MNRREEEHQREKGAERALEQLSGELEANLDNGTVDDLHLRYEMRNNSTPMAIFQTPKHRHGFIFHRNGRKETPFVVGIPRPDENIEEIGTVALTEPLFEERLLDLVGQAIQRLGG